jgi:hypothetical protein
MGERREEDTMIEEWKNSGDGGRMEERNENRTNIQVGLGSNRG